VSRRISKSGVKSLGSTEEGRLKLETLSVGEVGGIPSVEVKFVDIRRNIRGESGLLADH
jgi:hypothetical protein